MSVPYIRSESFRRMIRRRDRDEKLDLPNLLYEMAGPVLLVHKVKVAKLVEGALIPQRWAWYLDLSHESNTGRHVRSRVVVCTRLNYSKQYPSRNLVVTLFDLLRRSVDINTDRSVVYYYFAILGTIGKQFRVERIDFWQR